MEFFGVGKEFRQAIELTRTTLTLTISSALNACLQQGRFDEAIAAESPDGELDPVSPIIEADLGPYSYSGPPL
ncbi:MAG: hypothetical protein IPG58_17570 [Acidobacteria bacterium]|nr:hypothetical protein [Acidobacteriota bacterium]